MPRVERGCWPFFARCRASRTSTAFVSYIHDAAAVTFCQLRVRPPHPHSAGLSRLSRGERFNVVSHHSHVIGLKMRSPRMAALTNTNAPWPRSRNSPPTFQLHTSSLSLPLMSESMIPDVHLHGDFETP